MEFIPEKQKRKKKPLILQTMRFIIIEIRRKQNATTTGFPQLAYFEGFFLC